MSPEVQPAGFANVALGRPRDTAVDGERERARAAGYAIGYAAGVREAARQAGHERVRAAEQTAADDARRREEHRELVDALGRAAAAARARTAPVLADAEATLVAAAVELAQAVLRHELADGPRSARAALARALDVPGAGDVHAVRMHPRDAAIIQAAAAAADVALPDGVAVVADPTLDLGDAVSEHVDGYLDARVSTALARALAALGTDAA